MIKTAESIAETESGELSPDSVTRFAQLAWAIGSPPLLNHALRPHVALTAAEAAHWWQMWQPPCRTSSFPAVAAAESVAPLPPTQAATPRLGIAFERLWQFWLSENPHWQMLAHNMPVRELNRTLGELDLVVRNRHNNEQEHWELAVKFYLGYGNLDLASSWHGPQFRDRMDHKLVHLRDEQLCWKDRPAGQMALKAAGLAPIRARAIIKGRLCYPLAQHNHAAAFAAAGHERGLWATAKDWQDWLAEQTAPVFARPLSRSQWLAPIDALNDWRLLADMLQVPPEPGERPMALQLRADPRSWPMVFVVPPDWSTRAAAASLAT